MFPVAELAEDGRSATRFLLDRLVASIFQFDEDIIQLIAAGGPAL